MEIADLLTPDSVRSDLRVTSKKQALQAIAHIAADAAGVSERTVFDVLLERERLGTTGVGGGIAIPHGKVPGLDRIHAAFVKLGQPIGFDAIDDQPVDLIFLLLAPESAGAEHLKALARISRLLRDKALCRRLRDARRPRGV
jgi:PTS system nitrogen regulatory IIA component